MTKQEFLAFCLEEYGTAPDYPFREDSETAVLRHGDNGRWYALLMRVPRQKFGQEREERTDVVNLKLPPDLFGSFCAENGVYPAYHMNKLHWVSVLLPDAPEDVVRLLTHASYEITKRGKSPKKQKNKQF